MNKHTKKNMEQLEKWKRIRNITFMIFVCLLVIVSMVGLGFAMDTGGYPDSHFGLTRFESFKIVLGFIFMISAVPPDG